MTFTVAPPVAVGGEEYEIRAGEFRATVTEVGATLRALRHGERPLLDTFEPDQTPAGAHGQVLMPWPNRVDGGRYRGPGGEPRQLDITEPERDTAIHGLVRWATWTPMHAPEARRLVLRHRLHGHPGYPHVLDLTVAYEVDARTGLTVAFTAVNVGSRPAPYGHGAHPYLTAGADHIDACHLLVTAERWLPTDDRGIPTGVAPVEGTPYDFRTARPLGGTRIDHAYTDLRRDGDGRAQAALIGPDGTGTELWVDETFHWLEVFTGDTLPADRRRTGLGVEPMSCPPNAFAGGDGVIVLAPGESTSGRWGIRPTR